MRRRTDKPLTPPELFQHGIEMTREIRERIVKARAYYLGRSARVPAHLLSEVFDPARGPSIGYFVQTLRTINRTRQRIEETERRIESLKDGFLVLLDPVVSFIKWVMPRFKTRERGGRRPLHWDIAPAGRGDLRSLLWCAMRTPRSRPFGRPLRGRGIFDAEAGTLKVPRRTNQ